MKGDLRLRKARTDIPARCAVPHPSIGLPEMVSEAVIPKDGTVVLHLERI
jgi:hypothetical protein